MGAETDLVEAEVAKAKERFSTANPASRALYEKATGSMPGGNTRSTLYFGPFPLTMASGEGCRMVDVDGHEYFDLLGEYTAGLYGHSNPVVRAAIDETLDSGWSFGAHGTNESLLAQLLCERFPSLELVRFTNSGTEANLMAVGTATVATGRSSVLVFDGGYHGGLLSFGGGGIPINVPHEWVIGTYNDIEGTEALIRSHHADLAAILVEPMLGSGGCVPADPEFLAMLRRAANDTGALLIFDEVMTSRMSAGGMQSLVAITPDLMTLGKYVGGGMSFGAFGGREDLMSIYDPRAPGAIPHAGTFNNNVLSMAAGYAGLSQIFTADAAAALFDRGTRLRERLNSVSADHEVRMQWTGLGSMMTVHFQSAPIRAAKDIEPQQGLKQLFHLDMLEQGFYLATRGMLALSLEVGDADLDGFVAAVEGFVRRRGAMLAGS